jgi:hypothetical protein
MYIISKIDKNMSKVRISEQKLAQIIRESVEESIGSMMKGFNAARRNFKANKWQSFGNRVANSMAAGNREYIYNIYIKKVYNAKLDADELYNSGAITHENHAQLRKMLDDIFCIVRNAYERGSNDLNEGSFGRYYRENEGQSFSNRTTNSVKKTNQSKCYSELKTELFYLEEQVKNLLDANIITKEESQKIINILLYINHYILGGMNSEYFG